MMECLKTHTAQRVIVEVRFTITNANGENPMRYKVNTAGTRFSNTYSTTAGDLAKTIKNALLK